MRFLADEDAVGIIPAYAGSTQFNYIRVRDPKGSSPHTRGARQHSPARRIRSRIIPAYAGSTGLCNLGPEAAPDHPRIRGEHAVDIRPDRRRRGSSPHTRGAPSCAQYITLTPSDHPRIRGEHVTNAASAG